jgi:hypothetical protein
MHSALIGLTSRGSGLMRRELFESVWLGPQAFMNAAAFNANIGSWNTAVMTTMSSVCAHCFTHFSSIIVCTTDSTESLSGLRQPNRRSCRASRWSSASTSLRTHSARWTLARAMHWTDPSGLMRRGLLESVWLGPQAFSGATAFNHDIGAWNTAAMTTMASVCALIAIASVCQVCFVLACVLHSFLEYYMCTSEITEDFAGFCASPNRRSCRASRPSSASTYLRTHSAHWTLRAHCTGLAVGARGSCGEGSLRAFGSARRRSMMRRRSTRTSEPGTLLR